MTLLNRTLLGIYLAAMAGCAADQKVAVLNPVGPGAPAPAKVSHGLGFLVVYTAIEEPKINPDTQFYPHTSYAIYDDQGVFPRGVRNHVGAWDEFLLDTVGLPAGRYSIRAQSEINGDVSVPVIIKGAKTTVVNLQRQGHRLAGT